MLNLVVEKYIHTYGSFNPIFDIFVASSMFVLIFSISPACYRNAHSLELPGHFPAVSHIMGFYSEKSCAEQLMQLLKNIRKMRNKKPAYFVSQDMKYYSNHRLSDYSVFTAPMTEPQTENIH